MSPTNDDAHDSLKFPREIPRATMLGVGAIGSASAAEAATPASADSALVDAIVRNLDSFDRASDRAMTRVI